MGAMPQLTQEQQAAIQAFNEANAPLAQAATEARNALNAAIYTDAPDTADIKAKAEKLAAADLTLAQARAEAFAKLQASPNKLNLSARQIILLLAGSGGRFGGQGLPPGGFGGGPGGAPPGPPPDGQFGGGPPRKTAMVDRPICRPEVTALAAVLARPVAAPADPVLLLEAGPAQP